MAGRFNPNYNPDQLIEALDRSKGFILEARRYIKKKWGYNLSRRLIEAKIKSEGMEEWLADVRCGIIEDCMRKVIYKALHEGDSKSLIWLLEKFGQHINFLKPAEVIKTNDVPAELIAGFDRLRGEGVREIECEAVRSVPEEHRET